MQKGPLRTDTSMFTLPESAIENRKFVIHLHTIFHRMRCEYARREEPDDHIHQRLLRAHSQHRAHSWMMQITPSYVASRPPPCCPRRHGDQGLPLEFAARPSLFPVHPAAAAAAAAVKAHTATDRTTTLCPCPSRLRMKNRHLHLTRSGDGGGDARRSTRRSAGRTQAIARRNEPWPNLRAGC